MKQHLLRQQTKPEHYAFLSGPMKLIPITNASSHQNISDSILIDVNFPIVAQSEDSSGIIFVDAMFQFTESEDWSNTKSKV